MSKTSNAIDTLPPAALKSLRELGADLALGRLRRKESLKNWAARMNVSIPTLMRMEKGEPSVAIGVYATCLWMLGRSRSLAELAHPKDDLGALEQDILQAKKRYSRNPQGTRFPEL
jgi:hypothetical protein